MSDRQTDRQMWYNQQQLYKTVWPKHLNTLPLCHSPNNTVHLAGLHTLFTYLIFLSININSDSLYDADGLCFLRGSKLSSMHYLKAHKLPPTHPSSSVNFVPVNVVIARYCRSCHYRNIYLHTNINFFRCQLGHTAHPVLHGASQFSYDISHTNCWLVRLT